jgi:hypothetical protein
VEAKDYTSGPWAEVPFACADRGADPAPDCGPGVGRLAAYSIEQPELEESNSGFALARCGVTSTTAEPVWRSLDWPVGCFPEPCALADASAPLLLFFSAMMSSFSCRKKVGDRSPRLALKKGQFVRRYHDIIRQEGSEVTSPVSQSVTVHVFHSMYDDP